MEDRPKSVLEVLKRARDYITPKERWAQGYLTSSYTDAEPQVCSLGAMAYVIGLKRYYEYRWTDEEDSFLREAVDAYSRVVGMSVAFYNDLTHTTHSDVLAVFDKAIAAEECKELKQQLANLDKEPANE